MKSTQKVFADYVNDWAHKSKRHHPMISIVLLFTLRKVLLHLPGLPPPDLEESMYSSPIHHQANTQPQALLMLTGEGLGES